MSSFKGNPKEVDEFLGGPPEKVQPIKKQEEKRETPTPPEPRIQKNFRVRKSIADELMREAMEESIRTGRRVTQEGIIEQILEERYKDI